MTGTIEITPVSGKLPTSGTGIAASAKFNPHLWEPDELRAIFVARQQELTQIMNVIRGTKSGSAPQHMLITGQRGMGKTTLLQRVALAVEETPELFSVWLPLRFPEEQYTVSTPAELWANVLASLADALERQHQSTTEIDAQLAQLSALPLDQRESAALRLIKQWCQQHKRRLLLLMDNTDLLFSNLASGQSKKASAVTNEKRGGRGRKKDLSNNALWRIRKELLHSPHLFWLGGSYQPLETTGLYSDAFLDFFHLIELNQLTLDEMKATIAALARTFGAGRGLKGNAAEVEINRILNQRPERLQAMRQLAGGIPRTTIMLYELFAAGGQETLRADLERMLDTSTPHYKARIESLAEQQRKVLAHLMELWAPATANSLAKAAGLPVGTISAQLTRMELDGLVEKVNLSGTKRQGYQVAERFFNIWYLMRSASRGFRLRIGWLVEFMRMWYSVHELHEIAVARRREHRKGLLGENTELEYSRAVAMTLPSEAESRKQLDWEVFRRAHEIKEVADLFDLSGEDSGYTTSEDYLKRFECLASQLEKCPHIKSEARRSAWVESVLGSLDLSLSEKEDIAQKSAEFTSAQFKAQQKFFTDRIATWQMQYDAMSVNLVQEAVRKGEFFPDVPDAELAYTQMCSCFSNRPIAFSIAVSLLHHEHKNLETKKAYEKAIELIPTDRSLIARLGHLLVNNLKQYVEAEALYRKATELFPTDAFPWTRLAYLLEKKFARYDDAEIAYRKAVEVDPRNQFAWTDLGNMLENHSRYSEAEVAYRKAIEIDPANEFQWIILGNLLQAHLRNYVDAEIAYRKAIKLAPKTTRPLNGLGNLLQDHLERFDEAEATYKKAIEIDPTDMYVLANIARLYVKLGKHDDASDLFRTALTLSTDKNENLRLQAHCWLGNQDLAMQSLDKIANVASSGDSMMFYALKEQCFECQAIGLGAILIGLMERSKYAEFLQPFALALRVANGQEDALLDAAQEVRSMAAEVLLQLRARPAVSKKASRE